MVVIRKEESRASGMADSLQRIAAGSKEVNDPAERLDSQPA
jgi:hypothetical protein